MVQPDCNDHRSKGVAQAPFPAAASKKLPVDQAPTNPPVNGSEDVDHWVQTLGVGLPNHLARKVSESYDGMTPMTRFLVETCKIQKGQADIIDAMGRGSTSDCGATGGS